ncbi:MAG: TonB-dependent receptor [Bacteroidota bacterium]
MNKVIQLWTAFALLLATVQAQTNTLTQHIRGTVLDRDAQTPLVGATIIIRGTDPLKGAYTDEFGNFSIKDVPVGRITLDISYLGYEANSLREVLVTSGKELILNIELAESTRNLEEVVITAGQDKAASSNEMATVSARSFTVEETSRYASSLFDPARMAQAYAGVSIGGGTSDLFNEIVIRGNSPRGILWRLEGVEIPNPNHFGGLGSSGGAISMLSSSTLANSDFYTGAFPTEYGNALSGVFDLKMRAGNNEKREYSLMIGALGIEASAEGYFHKNSRASYLVNYRYSTLAALSAVGLNPVGDVLPVYQDLSFKIKVPTKSAGTFSLFGLGGKNEASFHPENDSTTWGGEFGNWGFYERQRMGTIGLTHRILLSDKSYLHTIISASDDGYEEEDYWLDKQYKQHIDDKTTYGFQSLRMSTMYNHKFNARHTFRAGLIGSHMGFNFSWSEFEEEADALKTYLDNSGSTQFLQAYAQWKYRIRDQWTLNSGVHYSHLMLNDEFSLEPRLALKWQFSDTQSLSGAVGLHSRMEHLATYLFEGTLQDGTKIIPNDHLELTKSAQAVIGYDHRFTENLRLKTEVYYQHLYDIPIQDQLNSRNSLINEVDIWAVIGAGKAVSEGTGRNYGVDLTVEKFFSDQYYFLITGSLFESKYTPKDGVEYNTAFNSNYQLNLLAGKEFKVGKKKANIIGINGKFLTSGGNRYTPLDLEKSREMGYSVIIPDQMFAARAGEYVRFDLGVSYKMNFKKSTHSIMIDVQNVTNHLNVFGQYYDSETQNLEKYYQTGLFPVFNYRIEF